MAEASCCFCKANKPYSSILLVLSSQVCLDSCLLYCSVGGNVGTIER